MYQSFYYNKLYHLYEEELITKNNLINEKSKDTLKNDKFELKK